jgi:hypothetical protein
MNNITNLHTLPLASAATVTTVQRALRDGMSPASLLEVADWNERKGYDERRRNSRKRLKNQAMTLRKVAEQLGATEMREAA